MTNFQIKKLLLLALDEYCRIVSRRSFFFLLCAVMSVYWVMALIGTVKIKTRLDTQKILPSDSPLQKTSQILDNIGFILFCAFFTVFKVLVWMNYLPMTVIVSSPFNLSDHELYQNFNDMVSEFESMPKSKGKQ